MTTWLLLTVAWACAEACLAPRQRQGSGYAVLSGGTLLLVTGWGLLHGEGSAWGALPFAVGVALRLLAIATLGERFTHGVELIPGHRLERSGIYRWMHHPSELGLLLIGLGTGLLLGTPEATLLMLPPMLLRIRAEEHLLRPLAG